MKSCNVRVRVCWVRKSMTCASVQIIALWRVAGLVWNWGCRNQSSGILDGVVRSICAIRLLECSHMSLPSPQAVILCSSVCLSSYISYKYSSAPSLFAGDVHSLELSHEWLGTGLFVSIQVLVLHSGFATRVSRLCVATFLLHAFQVLQPLLSWRSVSSCIDFFVCLCGLVSSSWGEVRRFYIVLM